MTAEFVSDIDSFRCEAEVPVELEDAIDGNIENWNDLLDELEAASYHDGEPLGVDANGVTWRLGPLQDIGWTPLDVDNDQIVILVTGYRDGEEIAETI